MRRKLTLALLAGALLVGMAACENTPVLTEQVYFEVGQAELTPDAQQTLTEVAEQIRDAGGAGTVGLAGHADEQGDDAFNQDLSERRASAVQTALTDLLGDTEVAFEVEAHGSGQPQAPNDTEENRAQNRRVEIVYWR